jgi:hypothetical protein
VNRIDEAHLDGAIDYKSENVRAHIAALCPDGIGGDFGSDILEATRVGKCEIIRFEQNQQGPTCPTRHETI